jgi:glutathione S-transferase
MAEQGGYDLRPYPSVRHWLERMQTLAGYVPLL